MIRWLINPDKFKDAESETLLYFALTRGVMHFGLMASGLFSILLAVVSGDQLFVSAGWARNIVLGFPVVGLVWGVLMWAALRYARRHR